MLEARARWEAALVYLFSLSDGPYAVKKTGNCLEPQLAIANTGVDISSLLDSILCHIRSITSLEVSSHQKGITVVMIVCLVLIHQFKCNSITAHHEMVVVKVDCFVDLLDTGVHCLVTGTIISRICILFTNTSINPLIFA